MLAADGGATSLSKQLNTEANMFMHIKKSIGEKRNEATVTQPSTRSLCAGEIEIDGFFSMLVCGAKEAAVNAR